MSNVALDRALALLLVAIGATGLLSLRAGSPDTAWLFAVHGLLGGALLALVIIKVRRSLPRAVSVGRRRRLLVGVAVAGLALGSLTIGFAAVASGQLVVVGPWTLISWHAAIGLLLAPLVLVHLLPHRWRILRPRRARGQSVESMAPGGRALSRRAVLSAAALGAVAVSLWEGTNVLDRARGGVRRFTGSRWLPQGSVPPPTTFFGEGTPSIDPAGWRLTVTGRVAQPTTWSLAGLPALGVTTQEAVLDCTSGWAVDTGWSGVRLGAVLDAAGAAADARGVEVRAVTGWGAALSMEDARRSLLATHVAGQPLPPGNGAPCRLVVPDRRGLDWVKWVTEVEVL